MKVVGVRCSRWDGNERSLDHQSMSNGSEEKEGDEEEEGDDEEDIVEEKGLSTKWKDVGSSLVTDAKPVELQEAFQSTSTSKYLESRFLIWNQIGSITCYNEQIQISFHDVSFHHSITIDNKTEKYSIGDLSLSAIVLASSATKGKLLCILYQSWDSNQREWTMEAEHSETIQLIRLTDDYVAMATSDRLIRLITLSGIQQRIIRLQGPIVSLSSYQNQLWFVYHSTQGELAFETKAGKDPFLSYRPTEGASDVLRTARSEQGSFLIGSIGVDTKNQVDLDRVRPLSPASDLIDPFFRFSDSGQCFYLEKSGHMSMLRRTKNNELETLLICNLKEEVHREETRFSTRLLPSPRPRRTI